MSQHKGLAVNSYTNRSDAFLAKIKVFTARRKKIFLARMLRTGNITVSALAAGVSRRWIYNQREADPAFSAAWDEAMKASTDILLEECRRRAADGVDEPVFYKGEVCGHVKKYSDTLLMFKIQAERPEYNRTIGPQVNVQVNVGGIPPALQAKLEQLYQVPPAVVIDVPSTASQEDE